MKKELENKINRLRGYTESLSLSENITKSQIKNLLNKVEEFIEDVEEFQKYQNENSDDNSDVQNYSFKFYSFGDNNETLYTLKKSDPEYDNKQKAENHYKSTDNFRITEPTFDDDLPF